MNFVELIPTFREWLNLIFGFAIGIFGTYLFKEFSRRRNEVRTLAHIASINKAWKRFNGLHPTLRLVQAGHAANETFPEESVIMLLETDPFILPEDIQKIRDRLSPGWLEKGMEDNPKVGIKSWRESEVSEDLADVAAGKSHLMTLKCHEYKYFDFMASHRRLAAGQPDEMPILRKYLGDSDMQRSIVGFPNPLSVGLTLLCEGGRTLAVTIRSTKVESGGDWHGGKYFNAVGENANPDDFVLGYDQKRKATPYSVARRGLREEVGLKDAHLDSCRIQLHSFAWAEDIRDHKFFGVAETDLSRSEIEHFWSTATSRAESKKLVFFPVSTNVQASEFWQKVLGESESWSPEAFLSTARTLVLLGRLRPKDLLTR